MDAHIDIGQLIIAILMTVIGWSINRTINNFEKRLASHDRYILKILNRLTLLDGKVEDLEGNDIEIT